jgi:hypothetical protein
MVGRMVQSVLIAACMAGCSTLPPPVDCGDLTVAECESALKAALPLLSPPPDNLVVAGSARAFVVLGCYAGNAAVVDVLIGNDTDIDARVREHGPNISHLCTPDDLSS